AAGRRVLFVDASRGGGDGSFDHPFATIGEAVAAGSGEAVIYVAETPSPYEENVFLTKGQMLIGSAFGLEAVRAEFHLELEAPTVAAMKGTGPVIHGSVMLEGNNVVAGCTITTDWHTGAALSAIDPRGTVSIRDVYIRTADQRFGLVLMRDDYAMQWTGGGLQATGGGSGISIAGGRGDVSFDRVEVSGSFTTGLVIAGRSGGNVVFRDRSRVAIDDAVGDAVQIESTKGTVRFESPLQVRTTHSPGVIVRNAEKFVVAGEGSSIETVNGVALDVRNTDVDAAFDRISATGVPPSGLAEGIVIDKVHGRLEVTGDGAEPGSGGSIAEARMYAVRITQSSGIRLRNLKISGGGTSKPQECPPDIPLLTNLRCRAALYLRHVENSSFENLEVAAPGGVGLNLNNVSALKFSGLHISEAGEAGTEPSLLIDELRGDASFAECTFLDGAGGAVVVEQQFNSGRVEFDRCEFAAPKRSASVPVLVRSAVKAPGALELRFALCSFHDSDGGAVAMDVGVRSSGILSIAGTPFSNIGGKAVEVSAARGARAALAMSGNPFVLPANRGPALVHLSLAPGSSGCIDASANKLVGGGGPQLRIDAPAPAQLGIVGASTAEELSSRNDGAVVALNAPAVHVAPSCP
ncbi:MAG TPA: right-handed parallel beta-helix repeat-containing protein, partial [Thermoanaerobaculia bacterium]|nr:right-handed parallel beta-helix repeat-containing protein [Thermoanaerobaculia bacterium]